MAQGDVRLFIDLPQRCMQGEVNLTKRPGIALVAGPKIASPTDENPNVDDYDLVVSSVERSQCPTGPRNVIFGPTGAKTLVSLPGSITYFYIPNPFTKTLSSGNTWAWIPPGRSELFVSMNAVFFPRIPGAREVYQMLYYDATNGSCICYVDMTPDDGVTPFDLDWSPVQLNLESLPTGVSSAAYRMLFYAETD